MARSRAAPEPPSPRRTILVGVGLLGLLAAAATWWLWPAPSRVSETAAAARNLLDRGGQPDRQAIRSLVAAVDTMPREELFELWQAVGEEWRRLRQEAIDRYFTAPAAEKPRLLDAEIERLKVLRELMVALNPQAEPDEPPRMPRERGRRGGGGDQGETPVDEAAAKADADRRAVAARYEEALAAHAKSRGVRLPTFR